jgi:Flp pilus assembly pilin Flp
MLKTLVRFIKESEGAGMFEYAILLGVGVAAAAGLGALLVPQIRQAIGRAASSLSATSGW